jgi:hypothetical protein
MHHRRCNAERVPLCCKDTSLRLHAHVYAYAYTRGAAFKYRQLRYSKFYITISVTIVVAIYAQRGAVQPTLQPLEKQRS